MSRPVALAFVTVVLSAGVFACSDGGGSSSGATSTQPHATASTPVATSASTPTTTSPTAPGPNEGGAAPIFWRTEDDFASVTAGQPYLVLFRITNGYDEPSLSVTATCRSCGGAQQAVTFEGQNSPPFPAGGDLPGSYYPMNITLPIVGHWELTVQAGADFETIPIDVKAAR